MEQALIDALNRLAAAIEEQNAIVRSGMVTDDAPECSHPEEAIINLTMMGTGERWVCKACKLAYGISEDELKELGL